METCPGSVAGRSRGGGPGDSVAAQAPATKASADLERRVEALLARMTLEEKLGQLQQLDGHAEATLPGRAPGLARKGLLGSTLNVRGAAQRRTRCSVSPSKNRA